MVPYHAHFLDGEGYDPFPMNGLVLGQRSPVIVVTGKVSLLPAVTEVSGGVNRGVPDGSSLLIFQKQDFGF